MTDQEMSGQVKGSRLQGNGPTQVWWLLRRYWQRTCRRVVRLSSIHWTHCERSSEPTLLRVDKCEG